MNMEKDNIINLNFGVSMSLLSFLANIYISRFSYRLYYLINNCSDENLDKTLLVGAGGPRENEDGTVDEGDIERYKYFQDNVEKYPYVNVVQIPSQEGDMSGTKVRKKIKKDMEQGLEYFVPEEIITSKDDMQAIEEILTIRP